MRDKRMTEEITDNDKCCVCGKVLFINGERQTNLCYHLGLTRELIKKNGWYGGGSESGVYICKSCFNKKNNELIMGVIWKGHERSKRIRKQRGEE